MKMNYKRLTKLLLAFLLISGFLVVIVINAFCFYESLNTGTPIDTLQSKYTRFRLIAAVIYCPLILFLGYVAKKAQYMILAKISIFVEIIWLIGILFMVCDFMFR